MPGHQDTANCLQFSPRGNLLLTGSSDRTARLWRVDTGASVGRPLVHNGSIRTAAFNADASRVLTGCTDGTVRLWDLATGQPLGPAYLAVKPSENSNNWVTGVAFMPDGKSFLFGGDGGFGGMRVIPAAEEGDAEQAMLRVQMRTGLELVEDASLVRVMNAAEHEKCRRRLQEWDRAAER